MKVQILSEYELNSYLIIDEATREAALVDPLTYDTAASAVQQNNVSLTKVLITDFGLGLDEEYRRLCEKFKDLQFYGGDDRIPRLTCKVKHDDTFNIGELQVRCLATPTRSGLDMCYHITGDQDNLPAVFTGNMLCVGSCGVLLKATPMQMYKTLIDILGSLPDETKVYCQDDLLPERKLEFGQYVEPENRAILRKLEWVREQVEKKKPIVPSSIREEKLTNPFMRVHEQSVVDYTEEQDPIKSMGYLKYVYDQFIFCS